jgi:hypothetical protein
MKGQQPYFGQPNYNPALNLLNGGQISQNQQPVYNNQPQMQQPYQMPPPPPTIIINQQKNNPTIKNIGNIGSMSDCPLCGKNTANVLRYKISSITIAWCIFLCFFGVLLAWVPFCCDSCKDT